MLRYSESKCHTPTAATKKPAPSVSHANDTTNMMMILGDVALVLN